MKKTYLALAFAASLAASSAFAMAEFDDGADMPSGGGGGVPLSTFQVTVQWPQVDITGKPWFRNGIWTGGPLPGLMTVGSAPSFGGKTFVPLPVGQTAPPPPPPPPTPEERRKACQDECATLRVFNDNNCIQHGNKLALARGDRPYISGLAGGLLAFLATKNPVVVAGATIAGGTAGYTLIGGAVDKEVAVFMRACQADASQAQNECLGQADCLAWFLPLLLVRRRREDGTPAIA